MCLTFALALYAEILNISCVPASGNSTKGPAAGEDQRGETAESQHDEDYIADLKETQGKAGTITGTQCLFAPSQREQSTSIWQCI